MVKVLRQNVVLDLDIDDKVIRGFTDLEIDVSHEYPSRICLHSHPCLIEAVLINGMTCTDAYSPIATDFSLESTAASTLASTIAVEESFSKENPHWPDSIISYLERGKFAPAIATFNETFIRYFVNEGNLVIPLPKMRPIDDAPSTIRLSIHFALDCTDPMLVPASFTLKSFPNIMDGIDVPYVSGGNHEPLVLFPCFNSIYEKVPKWEFTFLVPELRPLAGLADQLPLNHKILPVTTGTLVATRFLEKEGKRVFVFSQSSPMSAAHFGFAYGLFEIVKLVDSLEPTSSETPLASPSLSESRTSVQLYCLPGRLKSAMFTVEPILPMMRFVEWVLHSPCPFGALNLVVHESLEAPIITYAGLVCISPNLLYDQRIIDVAGQSRHLILSAVAHQFIYYKAVPKELADIWLLLGIATYLTEEFLSKLMGLNEALMKKRRNMDTIVCLDIDQPPLYNPDWKTPLEGWTEFCLIKSGLIFHMIDSKLGKSSLYKILNILFVYCSTTSGQQEDVQTEPFCSQEVVLSTLDFLKLVRKVTGTDLKEFAMQWIYQPGTPHLQASFHFNPKKASINLKIRQTCDHADRHTPPGSPLETGKFIGPLKIRIVERDGAYDHSVHIEEQVHTFEIPYHGKMKKPKKPKDEDVPNAEDQGKHGLTDETGIGLDQSESPICWVRVDPDYEWLRSVELSQPDYMWMEQLYKDKDVLAQSEAILSLCKHPSQSSMTAFDRIIADWKIYYQIRCMAVTAMASIALAMPSLRDESIAHLISIFEAKFCLPRAKPSDHHIVKPNNFNNIPNYYLQKCIPEALSRLKNESGKCPIEIQKFLLHILRYNDNTLNDYSDAFYVATVITSLAESLLPASLDSRCKPDTIVLGDSIAELERYRFMDLVEPSFHNIVTVAVLQAIMKLDHCGLLMVDYDMFWQYWKAQNFISVRITALEALLLLSSPSSSSSHDERRPGLPVLGLLGSVTPMTEKMANSDVYSFFIRYLLGKQYLQSDYVCSSPAEFLVYKLLLDKLKNMSLISTQFIETLKTDDSCRNLLRILCRKVLRSGRLELVEPALFLGRLVLPIPPSQIDSVT